MTLQLHSGLRHPCKHSCYLPHKLTHLLTCFRIGDPLRIECEALPKNTTKDTDHLSLKGILPTAHHSIRAEKRNTSIHSVMFEHGLIPMALLNTLPGPRVRHQHKMVPLDNKAYVSGHGKIVYPNKIQSQRDLQAIKQLSHQTGWRSKRPRL